MLWQGGTGGGQLFCSGAIGVGGQIYIASPNVNALYALRSNGAEAWASPIGTPTDSAAIGADRTVYVTASALYAIAPDGSTRWVNHDPLSNQRFAPSPAIGRDGTVYVATSLNFDLGYGFSLYAISPAGNLIWNTRTNLQGGPALFVSTPTIDAGGNIILTAHNSLFAITPHGSVLWCFSPGDNSDSLSSPAIGPDGTIYATFGTKLYAIAWTNALADSPWPMYQQNPRHTGKVEKPSLQKPQKRSDANFQFELYAQIDQPYTIEASTNLNTWNSLTSFVATTVPMDILDLEATNFPARFYRAVSDSPSAGRQLRQ